MGRLSRSTVRCSLRPWEDPWIPWTPWTLFQCQGALGCEATAMWGQLTRAVLERKREKEAGHCSYFHLPHQELLPPLWEPFKAAQVINKQANTQNNLLNYIGLCGVPTSRIIQMDSCARPSKYLLDSEVSESCHPLLGKRDDAGFFEASWHLTPRCKWGAENVWKMERDDQHSVSRWMKS